MESKQVLNYTLSQLQNVALRLSDKFLVYSVIEPRITPRYAKTGQHGGTSGVVGVISAVRGSPQLNHLQVNSVQAPSRHFQRRRRTCRCLNFLISVVNICPSTGSTQHPTVSPTAQSFLHLTF